MSGDGGGGVGAEDGGSSVTTTLVAVIFTVVGGVLCVLCGAVVCANLVRRRARAAAPKPLRPASPAGVHGLGAPRFSARTVLGIVGDGYALRSTPPPLPVTRGRSWRLGEVEHVGHVGVLVKSAADQTWLRASAPPRPVGALSPLTAGTVGRSAAAVVRAASGRRMSVLGDAPPARDYLADAMRAKRMGAAWAPQARVAQAPVAPVAVVPAPVPAPPVPASGAVVERAGASAALAAAKARLATRGIAGSGGAHASVRFVV